MKRTRPPARFGEHKCIHHPSAPRHDRPTDIIVCRPGAVRCGRTSFRLGQYMAPAEGSQEMVQNLEGFFFDFAASSSSFVTLQAQIILIKSGRRMNPGSTGLVLNSSMSGGISTS